MACIVYTSSEFVGLAKVVDSNLNESNQTTRMIQDESEKYTESAFPAVLGVYMSCDVSSGNRAKTYAFGILEEVADALAESAR